MQTLRTRQGWELSRSGTLAGTCSCGPVPVTPAQDSFVAVHAAWRRLPDADHDRSDTDLGIAPTAE